MLKKGTQKMFYFTIKEKRNKKNISLYNLNKLTGISYSYLSELENNRVSNPSLKTMALIANALNSDVNELFYSIFDIEKLREEMYFRIDEYGLNSKEVMEISHILDLLINIYNRSSYRKS